MGLFGNILGKFAGGALGGLIGGKKGRELGQELGSAGGSLLPFKKGGYVKKTTPALLHAGEFVLPASVKPTKSQKAAVAKGKKKGKK
tara:strand:+ start:149 stop:409 length:261 start_codon:yes stop_codon:yes gene_type:complete